MYMSSKYFIHMSNLCRWQNYSLFRQCFTWKFDRLSRVGRHTFFVVAVYLVQMSSVTDHWHPWPMQGQCMPEISVKIRTRLCRLNTHVHVHGNWHTVNHAYRCQGQAILLRYKRNSLYPTSLQHVIKSRGMKITSL